MKEELKIEPEKTSQKTEEKYEKAVEKKMKMHLYLSKSDVEAVNEKLKYGKLIYVPDSGEGPQGAPTVAYVGVDADMNFDEIKTPGKLDNGRFYAVTDAYLVEGIMIKMPSAQGGGCEGKVINL